MPKYDTIIQGGRLLDPASKTDATLDVGIAGRRIVEVSPELDPSDSQNVIDASGKWVMPGVIDSHVHVSVSRRRRSTALGHRQMAEAGVTTAIDFAGTMQGVIDGIKIGGAGLNIGGLYVLAPGSTIGSNDASKDDLNDTLKAALVSGSLGFKCIGGHYPMTPDATARAIEVCNENLAYVGLHCGTSESSSNLEGLREVPQLAATCRKWPTSCSPYQRVLSGHGTRCDRRVQRGPRHADVYEGSASF